MRKRLCLFNKVVVLREVCFVDKTYLREESAFLIHSLNEIQEFNNNEASRQEANNKQKGR